MTESFSTLEPRNGQSPAGELALRIRGGDYHGRVVRIRATQCTIGSAPDCTLRLTTPGVRPLHCIVLRGDAGATVRRWSPDTQLNGRAFSDALLVAGDRLEVGPIELEVLDEADRSPIRRSPEPDVGQLPVTQLAGEIVQHIRRDLQRNEHGRKQKTQQKRLVKSNRRVKQLEAELEQMQALLSAAQQTCERTSATSLDVQPLGQQRTAQEAEQQKTAWEAERRDLLKSLDEKKHLQSKLEAALVELHSLQQSQQSVVAPSNSDDDEKVEAVWEVERRELLKSLEEKDHLEHRLEAALGELSKGISNDQLAAAAQQQEQLAEERRQLRARAADLEQLQAWCNEVERRAQEDEAAAQAKASALETRITELEAQLAAAEISQTAARGDYPASAVLQSTGINEDCYRDAQLVAAQSSVEELRRASDLSSQEWGQREQVLSQRIE
jgi:hypothetical protein